MRSKRDVDALVSDKRCSAVHRGVSRDGRFISGNARNQESDGDTRRRDSDLDRFRPFDRRNTLVLCLWCIILDMSVRKMDPRPIYFRFWCLMTNTTKLD